MIDLKPACRGMIDVLALVTDDQLGDPTPCTDYNVSDLIDHVSQVSRGFASVALQQNDNADEPMEINRPPDTERTKVAHHVRRLGEAWDDPTAWNGSANAGGVELSNELWGKIALTEMVVHGWDLARATGQTLDVGDTTLRACLDHVTVFLPNAPVPELWGTQVEVSEQAPLIERIVAIAGRTP